MSLPEESLDVGNICFLEHVNINVACLKLATVFYFEGLGLTRDPFGQVGSRVMWANIGRQQFHLVVSDEQSAEVLPGRFGLILPSVQDCKQRLKKVEQVLKDTKFSWSLQGDNVLHVTGPWGNQFCIVEFNGSNFHRGGLGVCCVRCSVSQPANRSNTSR